MTKSTAMQMKEQNFSGKDATSIITFLPAFRTACDDSINHRCTDTLLFKNYLTAPLEAVIKAQFARGRKWPSIQRGG